MKNPIIILKTVIIGFCLGMNRKLIFRLIIDFSMTILLLFAFAYQLTGNTGHEIVGTAMLVLFIFHNFINLGWYKTLFKGKYPIARIINISTNILLLLDMVILMISGIMVSQKVFSFLSIDTDFLATQIHASAAYWGLILISIHLGNHWNMMLNGVNKMLGNNKKISLLLGSIGILIALYGIKASFEMDIGSKLFLQSAFSYWDFEKFPIRFFMNYLAIMGLYICITHYALKVFKELKKQK